MEEDSPYSSDSDGQKGTYSFEFSRPLRTMDRLQQVKMKQLLEILARKANKSIDSLFMCVGSWIDLVFETLFLKGEKSCISILFCVFFQQSF